MLKPLGLALAAATLTLAGWAGTQSAVEPSPAATPPLSPTATPTRPPTCPPALPISGWVTGATPTSLTVTYSNLLSPPCGYQPPMTVSLFASRADAEGWHAPVAEATSGPERWGTVTVEGLVPDTAYWFRFSDREGRRDPYVIGGPGRTTPLPVCAATAAIDTAWTGGFVATVTVRNTGDELLDGWRVSWRWAGDERVQTVWGGVPEGTGIDVAVRNAGYNGTLAPGGSTTFGLLVAASTAPEALTPSCAR